MCIESTEQTGELPDIWAFPWTDHLEWAEELKKKDTISFSPHDGTDTAQERTLGILYYSDFCYCKKSLGHASVKDERFLFQACIRRFQTMTSWPCCSGPVVAWHMMVKEWQIRLLTSGRHETGSWGGGWGPTTPFLKVHVASHPRPCTRPLLLEAVPLPPNSTTIWGPNLPCVNSFGRHSRYKG